MKSVVQKVWDYIEGVNGLLLILYVVFICAAHSFISASFSKSSFIVTIIAVAALAIFLVPVIMRALAKFTIKSQDFDAHAKKHTRLLFRASLYIIPFIVFLLWYLAFYPGSFSTDSIHQYAQVVKGEYNDWHPVAQTLFAFKLPLMLSGGWNGSIALFQIICFSLSLGYALNVILDFTNVKYAVISLLFVVLNPQTGYIVLFPWKDVSFAIGALLLLSFALQIFMTKGEWIRKPRNTAAFVVVATLTTLFRHNALLFTIPLILAVFFFISWKRAAAVTFSIVLLLVGIKGPLYSALDVESPGQRQIELLGLPMTVIGAAITYSPDVLDEETREFAYRVAPREVWETTYVDGSFNAVKWHPDSSDEVVEEYGASEVISIMLKCMKESTAVSLRALIRLTEAPYTINGDYGYFHGSYIVGDAFGLSHKEGTMTHICDGYTAFITEFFPYPFLQLGFWHLVLLISILSKCALNRLKDWKTIFFIVPVFVYNYGTDFLLTGVDDVPRFFYYTFLLVPVLLVFLYGNFTERSADAVAC